MTDLRTYLPGHRSDTPEAFARTGRRPDATTLVVCAGDSITQGQVSANYVNRLKDDWKQRGYQFVNAGINGQLAYNVAQRLDAIIACRPDVVTLLVGTNDVNAGFDAEWQQRYRRQQDLPIAPTMAWYRENIEAMLTRLRDETDARVAVIEIPILGEDLTSRMNALVDDYNAELRAVATAHEIPCLPLNAELRAALPVDHRPAPYEGSVSLVAKAAMGHLLLRRSWDDVGRRNGLALLTDHIHLNDRAAGVLADLISGFLDPSPPGANS
jgi:lysophospholipase L1-like esterase